MLQLNNNMESFESLNLPPAESLSDIAQHQKEIAPEDRELILSLMAVETGRAMALPGGDVLYSVAGPNRVQLEWTGSRDGSHRGDFTIRDWSKRVLFESQDGVYWKSPEGESWEMKNASIPRAVFEEIKPFLSSQDE